MTRALKVLVRKPVSLIGLIVVLLYVFFSFAGPLFIPAARREPKNKYQPPSAEHILGTDIQGKDNLIQLVYGGRDVLTVAFLTAILSTLAGVSLGALAALRGGGIDALINGLASLILALPQLPILVVLASVVKLDNPLLAAFVLTIFGWAGLMREVRSQMLTLKRRDYVEAAQLLDMGWLHIVFNEMLPNMMSFVAIGFIGRIVAAIFAQTTLAFLGLIPLSGENWGVMFSNAYGRNAHFAYNSAWNLIAPALAVLIFQLALVALQQAMDEVFNPRLQKA